MPPELEFENYQGRPSTSEVESELDEGSELNSIISGLAKVEISGALTLSPSTSISSSSSYRAADCIPDKYLNPLGFLNYNHLGQVPWGRDEDPPDSFRFTEVTPILGIDCEMVGVGPLQDSELGRVSIVNEYGFCIYDTFAKSEFLVTAYRSLKSGIFPENLEHAPSVAEVVKKVKSIVRGSTLVGHSIHNDLEVLQMKDHPETRDTAVFFKNKLGWSGHPSLKDLTKKFLKYEIQTGAHSSIEDAQATLKLYLNHRVEWEEELEKQRQLAKLPCSHKSQLISLPIKPIHEINIQPRENDMTVPSQSIFVRENKVIGSYGSSAEYLDVQFRLLLEDFLRPLRFGVKTIRTKGHTHVKIARLFKGCHLMMNGAREMEVRNKGVLMIPMAQNQLVDVDWDESKLFMNGSLLLVSPDNFKSIKFAIIQRGPKNFKSSNKPFNSVKLDLKFCKEGPSWVIDDTTNHFIVMESPAFYEAYCHTLSFLQTMPLDKFPLKPYIVDSVTTPCLPQVLLRGGNKVFDFQVFVGNDPLKRYGDPLNFETWPSAKDMGFDPSQYDAFRKSLTQQFSIIQGPPGTGKTFIGVQTIKFLLTNLWLTQSCPILVVSYTNHALDQTLEKVYKFLVENMCGGNTSEAEQLILRIGGGSKSDTIQPMTLRYKIEQYQNKQKLLKTIARQKGLIGTLDATKITTLTPGLLNFQKLPTECRKELARAAGNKIWKAWMNVENAISGNPIRWFGLEDLGLPSLSALRKQFGTKTKRGNRLRQVPSIFYFEFPDLLKKILEKHPSYITAGRMDHQLASLTLSTNLVGVSEAEYSVRWGFYLYLLRLMSKVVDSIQNDLAATIIKLEPIKHCQSQAGCKKSALVLGMTTTGAVKYKKLVNNLKPKIMFVEEAAHVLEAHVVASLTQHCEQMIMIGDHQQLRPMTADHDMSSKYRLDVSLMERLVRNGISQKKQNWVQLKNQHRMRPEIARMVCPVIYPELYNDPCVELYPHVLGCQKNIYFVDHQYFEARERGSASFYNKFEVDFVVNLTKYFEDIGYKPEQITIVATYLAQKTLIENKLNNMQSMGKTRILVSTVDGYQGEENDIVILSLVRSNQHNNIGFLKTNNRVCVALSRARHGFFMIGNMNCLKASSDTWYSINNTLLEMNSIGPEIPFGKRITGAEILFRCPHNNSPDPCQEELITECSHKRAVKCSSVSNKMERPTCGLKCDRIFRCGHPCRFPCHDSDDEKHKNYQCRNKCTRVCPEYDHPCPGNHPCYTDCQVHIGRGCQAKMALYFSCGHGSENILCNIMSSNKGKLLCKMCLDTQQKVQQERKKLEQLMHQLVQHI